jgi:hypothetical protein
MAIPHTKDGNVRFIPNEPDWSQGMEVRQIWNTKINESRDGSEQRIRRMKHPKFLFTYALTSLDADEFSVRRSRQFRELEQLVVAPIWALQMDKPDQVSLPGSGIINWNNDWDFDGLNSLGENFGFKVGGYAYIQETGLQSTFVGPLTTVGPSLGPLLQLAFSTTAAFPSGSVPTFTTACDVWPCISGIRIDGAGSMLQHRIGFNEEIISIQEV